jgi:hypothetical protein
MLTLLGPRARFCDGNSRRSFLTIGGLALGGLGLPALPLVLREWRELRHPAFREGRTAWRLFNACVAHPLMWSKKVLSGLFCIFADRS